jgi:hypothetical protein
MKISWNGLAACFRLFIWRIVAFRGSGEPDSFSQYLPHRASAE